MDNLARKLDQHDIIREVGTITRSDEGGFIVATGSGELSAKRSASCLVKPQPGDYVLLSTLPTGQSYVTAVLERDDAGSTSIAVEGDLRIRLPNGRLSLAAQEGLNLVSAKDVSFVAGGFNVNAVDANVILQRLTYLGTYVRSEVEKIKTFAGTFDSVLERFSQRVSRSYRTVEELDQVRAARIDYVAKKTLSLHGDSTLMTAKQLVKVDGEQIHLG